MKGRKNTIYFQLSIGFILLSWMREDGEDERKMKRKCKGFMERGEGYL
jgi:hypothetical protein